MYFYSASIQLPAQERFYEYIVYIYIESTFEIRL